MSLPSLSSVVKSTLIFGFVSLFMFGCNSEKATVLISPDSNIKLSFELIDNAPHYSVSYKTKAVVLPSKLGYEFKNMPSLINDFEVDSISFKQYNDTWEQPWGEQRWVKNECNEMTVQLKEKGALQRNLSIVFRVYNDGIAFRYILPEQPNVDSIEITKEITEFALTDNHDAWWIKAYQHSRYEYLYQKTPIHQLDSAHTPLTMETKDGLFLSIHEADLKDYSSMTLDYNDLNTLQCNLFPWPDGVKVKLRGSATSPWRTMLISDNLCHLTESLMMLNLNEPNALGDVSWVKPIKYIGIWWGMHIDLFTFGEGNRHGATTKRAKEYIDFAAENGFKEVLVEGWNKGFDSLWWRTGAPNMKFTIATDDYDVEKVQNYALSKGVVIQGYNETAANTINYLSQIDSAFKLYKRLGYKSLKIGQVGSKLDSLYWHHGQYGVNYYRYVLKKAAEYQFCVNFHEPIKDCGERRTYPNMLAREGARGQEYNAWSSDGGNPPAHTCILPFTRLLASPMDYTPGIFGLTIPSRPNNQISSTLAQQLALYVVIYSPLQMAADIIENYKNHPAFKFIKDVPVDWEYSKVLEAKIGDYITVVRKDRNSNEIYLGAITNENARDIKLPLSFLEQDKKYTAEIYRDGASAHWKTNPADYLIESIEVDNNTEISYKLAEGGGLAIRFIPLAK